MLILLLLLILVIVVSSQTKYPKTIVLTNGQLENIKQIFKDNEDYICRVGKFKRSNMQPYEISNMKLKNVMKSPATMLQYKDAMDTSQLGYDIKACIGNVFANFSNLTLTLRVCSSPWYFEAHFDCTINYVLLLHGAKRFLLFNMRNDIDSEYLNKIKNKSIHESNVILQNLGIRTTIIDVYAGEMFYLPPKVYHKVESIGNSNFSVLLNMNGKMSKGAEMCDKKFNKIWDRQSQLCHDNSCLY